MSIGCKYVNKSRDIMHFKSIYANERNNHYGLSIHFCFLFVVSISKISHTPRITAIYFTFHSTRLVYKHSEQNHYLHWTTMDRAFSNWKIAVSILFSPLRKRIRFVVYYLCIFIVKWVCFIIIIIIVIIRRNNQYILWVSYGFKNEGDYYH